METVTISQNFSIFYYLVSLAFVFLIFLFGLASRIVPTMKEKVGEVFAYLTMFIGFAGGIYLAVYGLIQFMDSAASSGNSARTTQVLSERIDLIPEKISMSFEPRFKLLEDKITAASMTAFESAQGKAAVNAALTPIVQEMRGWKTSISSNVTANREMIGANRDEIEALKGNVADLTGKVNSLNSQWRETMPVVIEKLNNIHDHVKKVVDPIPPAPVEIND